MEYFLGFLKVFFSNNINIKIRVDLLLDNFKSNYIIFLYFSGLCGSSGIILQVIYDVPDFFFFKHSLHKVRLLGSIFKAIKLLSFTFAIIIFAGHYAKKEKG